jgi:hypothetical protein
MSKARRRNGDINDMMLKLKTVGTKISDVQKDLESGIADVATVAECIHDLVDIMTNLVRWVQGSDL